MFDSDHVNPCTIFTPQPLDGFISKLTQMYLEVSRGADKKMILNDLDLVFYGFGLMFLLFGTSGWKVGPEMQKIQLLGGLISHFTQTCPVYYGCLKNYNIFMLFLDDVFNYIKGPFAGLPLIC